MAWKQVKSRMNEDIPTNTVFKKIASALKQPEIHRVHDSVSGDYVTVEDVYSSSTSSDDDQELDGAIVPWAHNYNSHKNKPVTVVFPDSPNNLAFENRFDILSNLDNSDTSNFRVTEVTSPKLNSPPHLKSRTWADECDDVTISNKTNRKGKETTTMKTYSIRNHRPTNRFSP
ncbi:hypothetical protein M5689_020176 [Euphorbia peplus]|nr:hypothetical protein M5689_020176 [Euphorbia peplus]